MESSNFAKETFARNLQFNFKVNFKDSEDDSFNYNGFSGGLTFAIVNERDHQLVTFNREDLKEKFNIQHGQQEYFNLVKNHIADYITVIRSSTANPIEQAAKIVVFTEAIDQFQQTGKTDGLPKGYLDLFKGKFDEVKNLRDSLIIKREEAYAEIDKGWLFTVGARANFNKEISANNGTFTSVLLKGKNPELDVRSSFTYGDTIAVTKIRRGNLSLTAGANIPLLKSDKSNLVELKPYLEYRKIFKHLFEDEKREVFLLNADLRIKISDQLWLPITIKYDCKDENFLGFLNLSINLDSLK